MNVATKTRPVESFFYAAEKRVGVSDSQQGRLVFINGRFSEQHSQWQTLPHLHLERKFEGGIHLCVGASSMESLAMVFVDAADSSIAAWRLENTIKFEGGHPHLIEHHIGEAETVGHGTIFNNITVEHGELRYTRLQEAPYNKVLDQRNEFKLATNSSLHVNNLDIGAESCRHELQVDLAGERAGCVLHGVFALKNRQRCDTRITVAHRAKNTASDVLWRGVADGRAHGAFNGAITIAAAADGSRAKLSNKNLLLSAHSGIDTKPVLEIYTDEVKASHGATVGQLDEQALFYLRARGVPLKQARSLLTEAFCGAGLDTLPVAALREQLMRRLRVYLSVPPIHVPIEGSGI